MIYSLMELSWPEVARLDPKKTTVFCGLAPIEEHGRHLPIGVDVYETEYWMNQAVQRLNEVLPSYSFGVLPVIPLGCANLGSFPGDLHVSSKLMFQIAAEMLCAISKWGISNIVVLSGHADYQHTHAIEEACHTVNREQQIHALAPMGQIFYGSQEYLSPVTSEKRRQYPEDFHAGWIETSVMLDLFPNLVHPNYKNRPDRSLAGKDMADPEKVKTVLKDEGHIGFPKEADPVLGRALNQEMADQLLDIVYQWIIGSPIPKTV